jgi:hypothetical protein
VADVSGGVPGSLVMTMIHGVAHRSARPQDAAEVLSRVNDFVMGDMKKGMFVTVFTSSSTASGALNYAARTQPDDFVPRIDAAHLLPQPARLSHRHSASRKDLFRKSIESDTIQLAEDDILLIYTDSITEAMNAARSVRRRAPAKNIPRAWAIAGKSLVEHIKEEILSFTGVIRNRMTSPWWRFARKPRRRRKSCAVPKKRTKKFCRQKHSGSLRKRRHHDLCLLQQIQKRL